MNSISSSPSSFTALLAAALCDDLDKAARAWHDHRALCLPDRLGLASGPHEEYSQGGGPAARRCAVWEALSRATIVVSVKAPAWEKFAAAELAEQLAALTRLAPPEVIQCDLSGKGLNDSIVGCGRAPRIGRIAVGMGAAIHYFNLMPSDLSADVLGPEGFVASSNRTARLRTAGELSYALAGTQMRTGPTNSSHGTLLLGAICPAAQVRHVTLAVLS